MFNRLYTILLGLGQFMKSVNCSKPDYTIIATKFNVSSILITIISWDHLNLSLVNGYVTIPTQVIKYKQCCSRQISPSDFSINIKLNYILTPFCLIWLLSEIEKIKLILNPIDFWHVQSLDSVFRHSVEPRAADSQITKPCPSICCIS